MSNRSNKGGLFRIDGKTVYEEVVNSLSDSMMSMLDAVAEQVRILIPSHQSAVSYIPEGDFTKALHVTSLSDKYKKYRSYDVMPTGEGIWGIIFEQNISMRLTEKELLSHPRWKNFSDMVDARGLEHPPMTNWLAVPIRLVGGSVVGLIQLCDKINGEFTEEDEIKLSGLAKLIGPSLEVHYISERLRNKNEKLKKLTCKLEKSEKNLIRSNNDLQQFAYAAAHDLKEPVRMVSSFLNILLEDHANELSPEAQECIDFAVDGARRMNALITGLLDYCSVTNVDDNFTHFELSSLITDIKKDLKLKIDDNNVHIEYECLPDLYGNRDLIKILLQNLINNAIKFCDTTPIIKIVAVSKNENIEISIIDNGIGIDDQYLDRIFKIFKRLHSRDKYGGSGIGLTLCRKIVDYHGGDIKVSSKKGIGSIFTVSLPEYKI